MNEYSAEHFAYAKPVNITKSQQDEFERLKSNLRKTNGLLVDEMEKNQKFIEKHDAFSSTIDDLSYIYDSLTSYYEGLSD